MRLRVFILLGLTILLVGLSYVVLRALNMQLVNIAPAKLSNIIHPNTAVEETKVKEFLSEPALPILPSKSPSQSAPGSNDNDIEHVQEVFQPPKPPSLPISSSVDGVSKSKVKDDVIVDDIPNEFSSEPQVQIPPLLLDGDVPNPVGGVSKSENDNEVLFDNKNIPDVVVSSEPEVNVPRLSPSGVKSKPNRKRRPINSPPPPPLVAQKPIFSPVDVVSKSENNDDVIIETNRITDDVQSRKPGVQLPGESPSDVVGKLNEKRGDSELAPPIPDRKSSLRQNEPPHPVAKPDLTEIAERPLPPPPSAAELDLDSSNYIVKPKPFGKRTLVKPRLRTLFEDKNEDDYSK